MDSLITQHSNTATCHLVTGPHQSLHVETNYNSLLVVVDKLVS
jgi:hypothetical protein